MQYILYLVDIFRKPNAFVPLLMWWWKWYTTTERSFNLLV